MGVVVLGAGGKLGSLLRGHWPGDATWHTRTAVDIRDAPSLTQALIGAQAVICLAGVTNTSTRPMALNATLARMTLDAAQAAGAAHVFLMSSAAVYGQRSGVLSEVTPTAPLSDYGHAKVAMEDMASTHAHPNTVLRLGNVAGADAILGGWRPGFALDTFPDGSTPKRSYIGLRSLARVLHSLSLGRGLPDILNIAAPDTVEMGALLDAAGFGWTPRPANGETIAEVTLDTTRLSGFTDITTHDNRPASMVAQWQDTQTAP